MRPWFTLMHEFCYAILDWTVYFNITTFSRQTQHDTTRLLNVLESPSLPAGRCQWCYLYSGPGLWMFSNEFLDYWISKFMHASYRFLFFWIRAVWRSILHGHWNNISNFATAYIWFGSMLTRQRRNFAIRCPKGLGCGTSNSASCLVTSKCSWAGPICGIQLTTHVLFREGLRHHRNTISKCLQLVYNFRRGGDWE